jgi:hypothetical protein
MLAGVRVDTVTVRWSGTSHGALVYAGAPPPESLLLVLLAGDAAVARANRSGWFDEAGEDGAEEADVEPGDIPVTSDAENVQAVLERLHPADQAAQQRTLAAARGRVDADVERHWTSIRLVAQALLRSTTLTGDDVQRIVETADQARPGKRGRSS